MVHDHQMLYLSIHGIKDGQRTFNCGTRYDWYILRNQYPDQYTIIRDQEGILTTIDLSEWNWLPNYNIDNIRTLIATDKDERCEILYDRSSYDPRRTWVSCTQDDTYKYPIVHSTPKSGIRFVYSLRNDKGFFNIPKVIFGESGIHNAVIDLLGNLSMTHICMAIKVDTDEMAYGIKQALESVEFSNILKACCWSTFRIDYNMFTSFKKYWFKQYVNE
jgi:hypothetical protein